MIELDKRAARLAQRGHPWLYRDDLKKSDLEDSEYSTGAIVRVLDPEGRDLGIAFASTRSKIALRLCGSWAGEDSPGLEEFLVDRIERAIRLREGMAPADGGVRLVHGESDLIPGLVVDRYADVLVLQATTALIDSALPLVTKILSDLLSPRMILARNDQAVRRLEKLPEEVVLLAGESVERVVIEENGIHHIVRPYAGHKTGMYLDQQPARQRVKELASAAKVLDLFSYQGGFSMAALGGGATSVQMVDQSKVALELAKETALLNHFEVPEMIRGNVFDVIRDLRNEQQFYDLVVLDPPAFCKSRREVEGGIRGYRDLNRGALRLLAPGGRLVTCSCSHHLKSELFEETIRQAALDLPFRVFVEERMGSGRDHPALLRLPETEYLKVRILRRWD
ncbi:MAG: class I SAM-dependent rRNA methyltransferase [Planctomycetota bacterium]|nr:class I SAM-dependent rRNA methyltransferase [Planctomycetota bacterium]